MSHDLDLNEFEIVDAIPMPELGDRQVRLRTLEEAIEDLVAAQTKKAEGVRGYFIQVRPKAGSALAEQLAQSAVAAAATQEAGKMAEARAKLEAAAASLKDAGRTTSTAKDGLKAVAPELRASMDGIYLSDGALNLTQLMRSAELLFQAGEFGLARKIYRAIMKTGERPWLAAYEIGRCFESEGKLAEARAQYEESIAYQPLATTFQSLAKLLVRLGKDQEAAELLDRAVLIKDLAPELRHAFHRTAGECWARLDHSKEAARHFQSALQANPKCAISSAGLGHCALQAGDKASAHDHFAHSLRIDILNPTAILNLVKCAYELRNYVVAAEILAEYTELAPVNANLLYSLAGLQFHLGRRRESLATCQRITELAPTHSGAKELMNRITDAGSEGEARPRPTL